jgi:hypothetical protein
MQPCKTVTFNMCTRGGGAQRLKRACEAVSLPGLTSRHTLNPTPDTSTNPLSLPLLPAVIFAIAAAVAFCVAESGGPSAVDKLCCAPLPSPVRRVFYLSREGTGQEHEVSPPPNTRVLTVSGGGGGGGGWLGGVKK